MQTPYSILANPANEALFTPLHNAPTIHQATTQQNSHEALSGINRSIFTLGLLLISGASLALLINTWFFHYVGHNYFPEHSLLIALVVLITLAGTYLQFNSSHASFLIVRELFFFYLMLSCVALLTNAAQYTPYAPIDPLIIDLEAKLNINSQALVSWTMQYPWLKKILSFAYASLEYQIALIPLFIILTRNWQTLRSYYFLVLLSALIGFSVYYFFPTTAPASYFHSPIFAAEQKATGIKFNEIHQHLSLTTKDGGLVALPSFHAIWAWLCLYLVSAHRVLFFLLLPLNILLVAACILLGWHYPLDVVGAALVILISHGVHALVNSQPINK